MLCEKVLPLLSEYFDEALDAETAIQVSQHLNQCARCRKELSGISAVHDRLRSLNDIRAPEYLHDLVQHQVTSYIKNGWRVQLREALERQWSLIRTIDGTWWSNRILGTVMTAMLVVLIANGIKPTPVEATDPNQDRIVNPSDYSKKVFRNVQAKFGTPPAKVPPGRDAQPSAIHYRYLDELGKSNPQHAEDDTLSVVATIDPIGRSKMQTVLEPPSDENLLRSVSEVISSARCRPASKNGQAVPSYLVLIVSRVYVYN
ncbi:MAG: zf-HC2 domain-containing protein [Acidobacteria bacterium]|nr:zf-HC2 domain-containing protein [Acidobacteriota bacterium]